MKRFLILVTVLVLLYGCAQRSPRPPAPPSAKAIAANLSRADAEGIDYVRVLWELVPEAPEGTTVVSGGRLTVRFYAVYRWLIPGDANGDHVVDLVDYAILAVNFGRQSSIGFPVGDFNQDGVVSVSDYGILSNHFGLSGVASPADLEN